MARKRASGEGTIRKLPSGNWCARVTIDGVRKSHTATTQRKAREWLTEIRRDLDTDSYIEPSDITFGKWWDKWLILDKQDSVRESTLSTYATSLARLPKSLLDSPLNKVSRADVQGIINELTQRGLSPASVRVTATHVRASLSAAVVYKLVRTDPSIGIKLPAPRALKGELHLLTDAEYSEFVAWCTAPVALTAVGKANSRELGRQAYKDALLTILYTGLRKTECTQLMWPDLVDDTLKVKGTKNATSYRTILLDPEIMALLENRRKTAKSFYIFDTLKGKQLDSTSLYNYAMHFGHSVHDLRHTYATRAILAGVDVKTLSQILGHADVGTTLRLYVHPTEDSKREAVKRIVAARTTIIAEVAK